MALGISVLPEGVSAKIGYASKVQFGQMAGAAEPRLAHKNSGHKGPMQAGRAIGLGAATAHLAGNFAYGVSRQIGMIYGNGAIDEPHDDLGSTPGTLHQCGEPGQF